MATKIKIVMDHHKSYHKEQMGIIQASMNRDRVQFQIDQLELQYEGLKSQLAETDERLERRLAEMDGKLESVLKLY